MRLHSTERRKESAKSTQAGDCGNSKCLYNLSKKNSLASSTFLNFPALCANCSGSSMGWTEERMNDLHHNLFWRVFITSDVGVKGRGSLSCFGTDLFGTGITVDIFQRECTKCWSVEDWTRCPRTPLSWSAQIFTCFVISSTTAYTLIHINSHGVRGRINSTAMADSIYVRPQLDT